MFIENQIVKLQQEINDIMNDISWSEDGCTNLSWSERGWIISEMDELIGLIDSDSSFKDIEVAMKQIRYNAEYGYDIYKSDFEILIKLLRMEGDNMFDCDYIKELNNAYWAEEEELQAGIHPTQVIERIKECLDELKIKWCKITRLDWMSGNRVHVSIDGKFFGAFDYIENEFDSTPESRLIETIEINEMGLKRQ